MFSCPERKSAPKSEEWMTTASKIDCWVQKHTDFISIWNRLEEHDTEERVQQYIIMLQISVPHVVSVHLHNSSILSINHTKNSCHHLDIIYRRTSILTAHYKHIYQCELVSILEFRECYHLAWGCKIKPYPLCMRLHLWSLSLYTVLSAICLPYAKLLFRSSEVRIVISMRDCPLIRCAVVLAWALGSSPSSRKQDGDRRMRIFGQPLKREIKCTQFSLFELFGIFTIHGSPVIF